MEQQIGNFEIESLKRFPIAIGELADSDDKIYSETAGILVNRLFCNRTKIPSLAKEIGIKSDCLTSYGPIRLGGATMCIPLPTVFGNVDEVIASARRDIAIQDNLSLAGIESKRLFQLPLAFSSIQKFEKFRPRAETVGIPDESGVVRDFNLFGDEVDQMRTAELSYSNGMTNLLAIRSLPFIIDPLVESGVVSREISDAFVGDINLAAGLSPRFILKNIQDISIDEPQKMIFEDGVRIVYTEFVSNFNRIIARRLKEKFPNFPLKDEFIDKTFYVDFIRNLEDPDKFIRAMSDLNVLGNKKKIFKFVSQDSLIPGVPKNGTMQDVFFEGFGKDGKAKLRVNNKIIGFKDIVGTKSLVGVKEINYFLLMGGFLPVIYADDNFKGEYAPYSNTKEQLAKVGLEPIVYPFQSRREQRSSDNIANFYSNLLNK